MDIAEFLTARLDEDEATARWSGPARIAWLTYRNDAGEMRYTTVASTSDEECWVADGRELAAPTSARVVWDPARVLREVAAKRRVLAQHERYAADCSAIPPVEDAGILHQVSWYVLRDLATAWSDHPDYDPAWRA